MAVIDEIPDETQEEQSVAHQMDSIPSFVGQELSTVDGSVRVPYYSRQMSWSFTVAWLSAHNPSEWCRLTNVEARPDSRRSLAAKCVMFPLNEILVYRNQDMCIRRNDGGKLAWHLDNDIADSACLPDTLLDLTRLQETKNSTFSKWCLTHLFSQLTDRLMWAVDVETSGGFPSFVNLNGGDDDDFAISVQSKYDNNALQTDIKKVDDIVEWRDKSYNADDEKGEEENDDEMDVDSARAAPDEAHIPDVRGNQIHPEEIFGRSDSELSDLTETSEEESDLSDSESDERNAKRQRRDF